SPWPSCSLFWLMKLRIGQKQKTNRTALDRIGHFPQVKKVNCGRTSRAGGQLPTLFPLLPGAPDAATRSQKPPRCSPERCPPADLTSAARWDRLCARTRSRPSELSRKARRPPGEEGYCGRSRGGARRRGR